MNTRVIVAGLGGQGVIFASKVLAETALGLGYDVIGSETHGMSQRGGSVVSHLKVGPYRGPLVRKGTADLVLALNPIEAVRYLAFARPGGLCFVNAPSGDLGLGETVGPLLSHLNIRILPVDADRIALDCGSPGVANVVVLGFATSHPVSPFPAEAVAETLERISPPAFRALNRRAFERGRYAEPGAEKAKPFGLG